MKDLDTLIRIVDPLADFSAFRKKFADGIVVTKDGKLLLQQRKPRVAGKPDILSAFGGHMEQGETPMQGMVRELQEELGADVKPEDVTFIASLSEAETQHRDVVHVHFWQDRHGTITGCYEWEPREYTSLAEAYAHPGMMDYLRWSLRECEKRGLLKGL